jgi:IMP dehydrogenase
MSAANFFTGLMETGIAFDDVLIEPQFSTIESRKDVSINTRLSSNLELKVPILSANMDTVTGPRMARAMSEAGGIGCLHRFTDIEQNAKDYLSSPKETFVSIGVGEKEYERAVYLYERGAYNFIIDVAHGAALHVVKQYDAIRTALGQNAHIMIGNFATSSGINEFCERSKSRIKPDSFKVGIGGGSMCTTRVVTGCGIPTLHSVLDARTTRRTIIADGGIKTSGDIVKALAAGASAVMIGSLLSGTEETPGDIIAFEKTDTVLRMYTNYKEAPAHLWHKEYRGSASAESYKAQNKEASHRAPEGERTLVKYKGTAGDVINTLAAGLKSGMSYVDARDIKELQNKAVFYKISASGGRESQAHGKVL